MTLLSNAMRSSWAVIKRALIAGGLALAPLGLTAWIFVKLIGIADKGIVLLPHSLQPEQLVGFKIPGLGVVLTLLFVLFFGLMLRYYLGRRFVDFYESLLLRVPFLSGIYHGLKQLLVSIFSNRGKHFRNVVIIEYPRRGVYCLAFVTNDEHFVDLHPEDPEMRTPPMVRIFLPTTPNPTSGFYLLIPRDDVKSLDIGVDEAFKLIMSAGIVTPEQIRSARPL